MDDVDEEIEGNNAESEDPVHDPCVTDSKTEKDTTVNWQEKFNLSHKQLNSTRRTHPQQVDGSPLRKRLRKEYCQIMITEERRKKWSEEVRSERQAENRRRHQVHAEGLLYWPVCDQTQVDEDLYCKDFFYHDETLWQHLHHVHDKLAIKDLRPMTHAQRAELRAIANFIFGKTFMKCVIININSLMRSYDNENTDILSVFYAAGFGIETWHSKVHRFIFVRAADPDYSDRFLITVHYNKDLIPPVSMQVTRATRVAQVMKFWGEKNGVNGAEFTCRWQDCNLSDYKQLDWYDIDSSSPLIIYPRLQGKDHEYTMPTESFQMEHDPEEPDDHLLTTPRTKRRREACCTPMNKLMACFSLGDEAPMPSNHTQMYHSIPTKKMLDEIDTLSQLQPPWPRYEMLKYIPVVTSKPVEIASWHKHTKSRNTISKTFSWHM